ncbi:MAG: GNAT family N-acetyltransferase [Flavobacteriales bacterium]|nr:GNAT family N-acetyltransferase [Flavobacteriales bacterium]
MITFTDTKALGKQAIIELYKDARWSAYTKEPDLLMNAIENSLLVISAWDQDHLAGLIRVVGDGKTIIYIQDILVLKSHKRQGIGTQLMKQVLARFPEVRQTVLLTDDYDETRGFYESLGFESCDKGKLVSFARFNP